MKILFCRHAVSTIWKQMILSNEILFWILAFAQQTELLRVAECWTKGLSWPKKEPVMVVWKMLMWTSGWVNLVQGTRYLEFAVHWISIKHQLELLRINRRLVLSVVTFPRDQFQRFSTPSAAKQTCQTRYHLNIRYQFISRVSPPTTCWLSARLVPWPRTSWHVLWARHLKQKA